MEENCKISSPFNLNCWKHHAGFIAKQIKKSKNEKELKNISSLLLRIGESQMDLYLGELTPIEITEFTRRLLLRKKIYEYEPYKQWLFSEGKEYRLITLLDNSSWALRLSNLRKNYVHIHPGRYSPHTIRVRALTLKTAICVLAYINSNKNHSLNLETINFARKKYLKSEPVKALSSTSGLTRLLNILNTP